MRKRQIKHLDVSGKAKKIDDVFEKEALTYIIFGFILIMAGVWTFKKIQPLFKLYGWTTN